MIRDFFLKDSMWIKTILCEQLKSIEFGPSMRINGIKLIVCNWWTQRLNWLIFVTRNTDYDILSNFTRILALNVSVYNIQQKERECRKRIINWNLNLFIHLVYQSVLKVIRIYLLTKDITNVKSVRIDNAGMTDKRYRVVFGSSVVPAISIVY